MVCTEARRSNKVAARNENNGTQAVEIILHQVRLPDIWLAARLLVNFLEKSQVAEVI